MIVAQPNCSATWRSNKLVLFALALPSLGAATGFALLGAWPVLPFAGLELLALGSALYYVNWKQHYRHVITLSDDSIRIVIVIRIQNRIDLTGMSGSHKQYPCGTQNQ